MTKTYCSGYAFPGDRQTTVADESNSQGHTAVHAQCTRLQKHIEVLETTHFSDTDAVPVVLQETLIQGHDCHEQNKSCCFLQIFSVRETREGELS